MFTILAVGLSCGISASVSFFAGVALLVLDLLIGFLTQPGMEIGRSALGWARHLEEVALVILPRFDAFAATDWMAEDLAVPPLALLKALGYLAAFGALGFVLGWLLLRGKELP